MPDYRASISCQDEKMNYLEKIAAKNAIFVSRKNNDTTDCAGCFPLAASRDACVPVMNL